MQDFRFSALGTQWHISIDSENLVSSHFWQDLIDLTQEFETRFSRFKDTSEVTALRQANAGTYSVSTTFAQLLQEADRLRKVTHGKYDPAVGTLLEQAGYNKNYSLQPQPDQISNWEVPAWKIDVRSTKITIDGPVVFDLGGIGKGYWIDQLSNRLLEEGYLHHIVEGGGDMFGTTKADESSWQIALEWPGKTDTAIGMVSLSHQGLAASDVFKRKWGKWHHLLSVKTKRPVSDMLGCVAVAPSAFTADQMTSALSLTSPEEYDHAATHLGAEYFVLLADNTARVSSRWPGEVF